MADVSATPHTREALHAPPMKRAATRTPRVGISNIIAVWLWLGWVANYLFIFVGLGVSHALGWRVCRSVLLGFLGVLFLLPANAGVSFLAPTFGAWIMKRASEYFGMQLVFEEKAAIRDAQSPMIFAIEPHDVLPVSMGSFHPSLDLVPGHTCAGLTTSAVFSVPGLRNIYSILHAHPVDRSTFSSLLSAGKSVCFCPGGVQEVFHLAHEKEVVLFLKSRLGFAQIALQHRTPVRASPRAGHTRRPRVPSWTTHDVSRAPAARSRRSIAGGTLLHLWAGRDILAPFRPRQTRRASGTHDRIPARCVLGPLRRAIRASEAEGAHYSDRQARRASAAL